MNALGVKEKVFRFIMQDGENMYIIHFLSQSLQGGVPTTDSMSMMECMACRDGTKLDHIVGRLKYLLQLVFSSS